MSDKLTLSAAISVLMMTLYVVFGDQTARTPFGPAGMEAPTRIAIRSLPGLDILAQAGSRHILY